MPRFGLFAATCGLLALLLGGCGGAPSHTALSGRACLARLSAQDISYRPTDIGDPRDPHAGDPTWNTLGTVGWYLANGVPASKIVVGVPFYGNQYLRAGGLYQPFDNTGLDANSLQWDQTPQPTYHDLVDVAGIVGQHGYATRWDAYAGEPYLVNPAAPHQLAGGPVTAPTVVAYSDPRSIGERTSAREV